MNTNFSIATSRMKKLHKQVIKKENVVTTVRVGGTLVRKLYITKQWNT